MHSALIGKTTIKSWRIFLLLSFYGILSNALYVYGTGTGTST